MDSGESKLLDELAGSISAGTPVDWQQVTQEPADDLDTSILRELQILDRIATFHRNPDQWLSTATDPSDDQNAGKPRSALAAGDPRAWGHLTILEKIGEGTFAIVYRARDDKLQTDVALKLLKTGSPLDLSRALKEARLLARVRHPNVVNVYGADLIDGRLGIWMELVKGRTLATIVRTQGPFSAGEAKLIGMDVCRALAAVHREGLVHGDVKAHNVMREERGRTVLMDFGTGKDLQDDAGPRDASGIGDFAGTPAYLPPEIFDGKNRTRITDIYSLGVLLFHLVTDSYPVPGRSGEEIKLAHGRGERRRLRDLGAELPGEFIQSVERAIDPDPDRRYPSAGAFEAALLGRSPAPKPSTRFRLMALAASVAAGLIVAATIYNGIRHNATQPGSPASERLNRSAPPSQAAPAIVTYQIQANFYREAADQQRILLRSGQRLTPGDQMFVEVLTSVPVFVYIVNEDERGESLLLFPLTNQSVANPLAPGKTHRLPGLSNWYVDTPGGREHFIIFASPDRLADFEQTIFASLPRPQSGKPVLNARLTEGAKNILRSVGGLVVSPEAKAQGAGPVSRLFPAEPLGDTQETAHGLWIRELTVENPVK
jgi:serine/threonine-protein kinase